MALFGLGSQGSSSSSSDTGGVRNFLLGSPGQVRRFDIFTPEQQNAISMMLQQAIAGLQQQPGAGFEPIAQKARSDFMQQTVPGIAERFTSMGSGGALSSPAFASALGQAGAGMETGLAAERAKYGLDERQQLMSLLGMGLTPQFESAYQRGDQGLLKGLLGSLAAGATRYFTGA